MGNFEDFLRANLPENVWPTQKLPGKEIGTVGQEIMMEVARLNIEHDRLHEELAAQAKAFIDKEEEAMDARVEAFVDSLEEGHKPECIRLKEELKAVWYEAKIGLGINPDDPAEKDALYRLDADTGVVTRIVGDDNAGN